MSCVGLVSNSLSTAVLYRLPCVYLRAFTLDILNSVDALSTVQKIEYIVHVYVFSFREFKVSLHKIDIFHFDLFIEDTRKTITQCYLK